jgi:hypothetical protein
MVKTYDPGRVVISFAGRLIGGYADGTFVAAERSEAAFGLVIGAGGEGCRVRSRNKSGKVTITLMASSLSNDVLSAIAAADELLGTGQGPLFIKDLNGTTLVAAASAWIEKMPNIEHGKELANREWVIACEAIELYAGGNV